MTELTMPKASRRMCHTGSGTMTMSFSSARLGARPNLAFARSFLRMSPSRRGATMAAAEERKKRIRKRVAKIIKISKKQTHSYYQSVRAGHRPRECEPCRRRTTSSRGRTTALRRPAYVLATAVRLAECRSLALLAPQQSYCCFSPAPAVVQPSRECQRPSGQRYLLSSRKK